MLAFSIEKEKSIQEVRINRIGDGRSRLNQDPFSVISFIT